MTAAKVAPPAIGTAADLRGEVMRLAIAYDANVARLAELATALGNICDDNTVFHVAVNGHLGDKLASWSKEELAEALGRVYETASTALAKAAP